MVVQGAPEAMAVLGALEAMAVGPCGRGLVPLGPATTARTLLPPQKKIHGAAYGVSGALRGYPQEQGALTGLSLEAEVLPGHDGSTTALLGLDVESGALTGSLSNRFHFCDHGHNQRSRLSQTSLHRQDRTDVTR